MKELGKPRKKIIPPDELQQMAPVIYPHLLLFKQMYEENKINAPELVAHYLITFLKAWKPKTWCEGFIAHADIKDIPHNSIIHFIATNRLRLCSPRINRTLVEWYRGNYPIILLPKIPSAQSLLNYQIKGERIVTLFFDQDEISQYILNERDAFSFVCHDLMHADHFFEDESIKQTQIDFYRLMKKTEDDGFLKEPLQDPVFKTEWEYLIADMNAHGEHLKLSFMAFLRNYFLRSEGKSESETLSESSFQKYNEIIYSLAPAPSPRGSESV